MILAAGLGTRLRPATDHTPKALLEVGGRPMIEYPLGMLARAGVTDVVVNLHHLGDRIRAALGDGRRFGVTIHYSPEDPILDTGGAIARARGLLEGAAFFVANCDALLDPDLTALSEFHETHSALATLVLREDSEAERYGAIDVDASGRIRRFLGRAGSYSGRLERRMFCGVHLLSPAIFDHMPREGAFSITRDTYGGALASGAALSGFTHRGYWRDLGTPESIAAADRDLRTGAFRPSFLGQ